MKQSPLNRKNKVPLRRNSTSIAFIRSLLILFFIYSASHYVLAQERVHHASDYSQALKKLTDIMVNDVTSPVAASRYYAYATIAGNEIIASLDPKHPSFYGTLNDFPKIEPAENPGDIHPEPAVLYATLRMGELLLPSGYLLEGAGKSVLREAAARGVISLENIPVIIDHSETIIKAVMQYSATDHFASLSTLPQYTPEDGAGFWRPTPPAYMSPVEPNWNRLRPFLLDSASQFRPPAPVPYSEEKDSEFYRLAMEVYETTRQMGPKQRETAMFWDCNPFVLHIFGHMDFGIKKISPGAHWIGIIGIACKKAGLDFKATVQNHALVAIALADAFISCWDEKYRSNRIRPETVINRLIDPEWRPLLQTPPFPEYTSGHSVASTVAAYVLSDLFGTGFHYTDTVETEFGLPARRFESFIQASEEAAISRLYGGIHYTDAMEAGIVQGKQVAVFINKKFSRMLARPLLIGSKN